MPDNTYSATDSRYLMGTVVNLTLIGGEPEQAQAAILHVFARMEALEAVLSRYLPDSQLSKLNRNDTLEDAHPSLISVIKRAQEISQLTNGAFDITIKPVLDLYQSSASLPDENAVSQALLLVDYHAITLEDRTISFKKRGMSITLDGIAKGFIVDEGVAVLEKFGFTDVMIEAGGDLMAMGEKAPRYPWKIGLQAPRKATGNLIATFNVENKALATSGDYMQAFTPDFVNHHIIDPRCGHSPRELASVSVLAPTVTLADGLATSIMVMGKEGLKLIENLPACEAYAVTKDSAVLKTTGFSED
jgi:thiamine biosynthesis lipoprotein